MAFGVIDPFATIAATQGRTPCAFKNPGPAAYDPSLEEPAAASPVGFSATCSFQQGGPQGFQVDGEKGLETSYSGIVMMTLLEEQEGWANASIVSFAYIPNQTVVTVAGTDYQVQQIRKRFFEGVQTGTEFLLGR